MAYGHRNFLITWGSVMFGLLEWQTPEGRLGPLNVVKKTVGKLVSSTHRRATAGFKHDSIPAGCND